ncbi:MAG: hypothetical protein LBC84_09485 [Prevotellaceae bacterium]|jgi:hypothetical protein|nr:hypothetical protein [Prevotellaceae bacterium]
METNLNHEQSLTLINEMISRARNNVQKERRYPLLFWGYTIATVAILNYVLLYVLCNPNLSFWVWCLMLPAWGLSYFIDRKIHRTALVKTHIDRIGDGVWKGYGIGVGVFLFTIFAAAFRLQSPVLFSLVTPVILIMVGICEYASACIYRFTPWYRVAALLGAGAIACAFVPVQVHFLILALCMILGFVVPGHLLNRQTKKNHV